jgi:tRNA(fMet)-specific endonuclease VapC
VTKSEILRGRFDFLLKADNAQNLEKALHWLNESENLLAQHLIIGFDKHFLTKLEKFRYGSKFRKIGRADLLIASICLANFAVLVTRNVKHFKHFPNLEVENWVD